MMENNHDKQDLIMLYEMFISDIRDAKTKQWNAIFYGLSVLGALFAYVGIREKSLHCAAVIADIPDFEKWIIWFAFTCVFVFLTNYIFSLYFAITRYRGKINSIREKMSADFQAVVKQDRASRGLEFPVFFSFALWVGLGALSRRMFTEESSYAWNILPLVVAVACGICCYCRSECRRETTAAKETRSGGA